MIVCVFDCVLEQFVHSHPSEHSLFFFLQPHREVVQPVLHLQPFRSWMTRCLTASILLSLSQSKVRDSSVTFHPKLAREWRTMWLLLAAFHMSSTQHVNLQWWYCASVLGIISLSNCILSQISLVPRPCPAFCFLEYGKGGRGPGIFSHVSDIGIERMIERMVERVVERVYM